MQIFEDKDVAREEGGVNILLSEMNSETSFPVNAPPFLKMGDLKLSQTSNICQFLENRYGNTNSEDDKAKAHQFFLTIMDVVNEGENSKTLGFHTK